jgi:pimeloyl-ACP methyl ester carboxylesterase
MTCQDPTQDLTQPPAYPGAVAPDRSRRIDSLGVSLQVYEWGDPAAVPVVCAHGMFDHSRGFDLVAPLLARDVHVVAFDARGHGDSGWADSYVWDNDVADIIAVLRSLPRKGFLLGHSKGGGQVIDAAIALPREVVGVIVLDGFGPPLDGFDHPRRDADAAQSIPERFATYLDFRRGAAENRSWRPYESFDALVDRRRQQNPRLSRDWLRYFLHYGARREADGWRWKVDPHAASGFGPWRPDWLAAGFGRLEVPLLAVIGSITDTWGPLPEPILAERLAGVRRLERATVEGTGHFIHMEKPAETAALALDFIARHA